MQMSPTRVGKGKSSSKRAIGGTRVLPEEPWLPARPSASVLGGKAAEAQRWLLAARQRPPPGGAPGPPPPPARIFAGPASAPRVAVASATASSRRAGPRGRLRAGPAAASPRAGAPRGRPRQGPPRRPSGSGCSGRLCSRRPDGAEPVLLAAAAAPLQWWKPGRPASLQPGARDAPARAPSAPSLVRPAGSPGCRRPPRPPALTAGVRLLPGRLAARRSTSRLPAPAPRAAAAAAAGEGGREGQGRRWRAPAQSPSREPASELRPRREAPSRGRGQPGAPSSPRGSRPPPARTRPHPSRGGGGERSSPLAEQSLLFSSSGGVATWIAKCAGSGGSDRSTVTRHGSSGQTAEENQRH